MYISELIVKNFRNYENLRICFIKDLNFLIGYNGSGKTNLIEAISVTSNLKSFRNNSDSEMIRWGTDFYYCCANVLENDNCKFETSERFSVV